MNNRELDAKVAEEIFKWDISIWNYSTEYSTDIAAAMQVHLAMCESDPSTKARYFHALKDLLMEHGSFSIWTAALEYFDPPTICRAALKAVEE